MLKVEIQIPPEHTKSFTHGTVNLTIHCICSYTVCLHILAMKVSIACNCKCNMYVGSRAAELGGGGGGGGGLGGL